MGNSTLAVVVLSLGTALVAGCEATKDAPNLATLDVGFDWSKTRRCTTASPEFTVGGAPAGSATLRFRMTDLDNPSWNHGGGDVKYTGPRIEGGALTGYNGPCPPGGTSHRYEFVVDALNAAGDTVVARGKIMRQFPPK